MEPFLGQITMFAGNFAPRSWAFCNGQLLSIAQNQALFSILGTTYGGDGRTTFALPDLRGRAAMHAGTGPGLSTRKLGQRFGTETNTMTINTMPQHNHLATMTSLTGVGTVTGTATANISTSSTSGDSNDPNGKTLSVGVTSNGDDVNYVSNGAANGALGGVSVDTSTLGVAVTNLNGNVTIGNTGNQRPINNIQPVLVINYIIALQGTFPSRS